MRRQQQVQRGRTSRGTVRSRQDEDQVRETYYDPQLRAARQAKQEARKDPR